MSASDRIMMYAVASPHLPRRTSGKRKTMNCRHSGTEPKGKGRATYSSIAPLQPPKMISTQKVFHDAVVTPPPAFIQRGSVVSLYEDDDMMENDYFPSPSLCRQISSMQLSDVEPPQPHASTVSLKDSLHGKHSDSLASTTECLRKGGDKISCNASSSSSCRAPISPVRLPDVPLPQPRPFTSSLDDPLQRKPPESPASRKLGGKRLLTRQEMVKPPVAQLKEEERLHSSSKSILSNKSSNSKTSWNRPRVEIAPGLSVPLRGGDETWRAFCEGRVVHFECEGCHQMGYCINSCTMVICPGCRAVFGNRHRSPVAMKSLGLGLTEADIVRLSDS